MSLAFLFARVVLSVSVAPAFLMGEQTALCCCALSFKASVVTASIGNAGRAGTSFLSVRKPAEAFRVKVHVIASNSFDESLTRKITGLEQKRLDYE